MVMQKRDGDERARAASLSIVEDHDVMQFLSLNFACGRLDPPPAHPFLLGQNTLMDGETGDHGRRPHSVGVTALSRSRRAFSKVTDRKQGVHARPRTSRKVAHPLKVCCGSVNDDLKRRALGNALAGLLALTVCAISQH